MNEAVPAAQADQDDFRARLRGRDMAPLWDVMASLVSREPRTPCVPALWQYDAVRPLVMEAGDVITAKEAERRVLVLENPGMPGHSRITRSLYAGLQLILPGEVAPSHRHTQTALRFVIEGNGAYTAVDGERTLMQPGDFVTTPHWTWHDHGNESADPMVWLDGLDIPIVSLFDASFAEPGEHDAQLLSRPSGDALARYGSGLLPVDQQPGALSSPVFNYPYHRTREALEVLRRTSEWDPCHGLRMKYVNPLTGEHALPTMATFMQLLPAGFSASGYRSTDATVYACVEGTGETEIGGERYSWGPHDIFVVPSWMRCVHRAGNDDAVLFSFSDRAAQERLGLWREARET